jgi:predicted alpha/beta-hydrolase family hydrolase
VARSGAGPALSGVVALGYPLHPPGKPHQLRTAHLGAIRAPWLIVRAAATPSGTRRTADGGGQPDGTPVTLHVVEGGDPLVRGGAHAARHRAAAVADVVAGLGQTLRM